MKKLILTAILFVLLVGTSYSQSLFSATYTSNIRDTIAIAGSTDAGTDWFTNKGYDVVYVEIWNGVYWYTFEISAPVKDYQKFKVEMEGSDTTLRVQAFQSATVNISLPVWTASSTLLRNLSLDYGGDATTLGVCASPMFVQFRGWYKRDL